MFVICLDRISHCVVAAKALAKPARRHRHIVVYVVEHTHLALAFVKPVQADLRDILGGRPGTGGKGQEGRWESVT
ncbi:MAG: hypothetical protein HY706_17065 [Candidatus Hydrogenedentes bacterium]|nr:hypothetical protein [Candidatus Hydrogenedentota bacterium]